MVWECLYPVGLYPGVTHIRGCLYLGDTYGGLLSMGLISGGLYQGAYIRGYLYPGGLTPEYYSCYQVDGPIKGDLNV